MGVTGNVMIADPIPNADIRRMLVMKTKGNGFRKLALHEAGLPSRQQKVIPGADKDRQNGDADSSQQGKCANGGCFAKGFAVRMRTGRQPSKNPNFWKERKNAVPSPMIDSRDLLPGLTSRILVKIGADRHDLKFPEPDDDPKYYGSVPEGCGPNSKKIIFADIVKSPKPLGELLQ